MGFDDLLLDRRGVLNTVSQTTEEDKEVDRRPGTLAGLAGGLWRDNH